jgi:hypothetical protein
MKLAEVQNKKILLSCLNWGMGHVARSIGLIRKLLDQNNTVVLAGNPAQLEIFRTYFSDIQTLELDDYPFEFEKYTSFHQAIWKQKSKLRKFFNFEKKWVEEKVKEFEFDLILSDHRYGFRSSKATSIFITHQIQLSLNGAYKIFQFFHSYMFKQFDSIWIVDNANERLAGKLSRIPKVMNFEYIGFLSRFEIGNESIKNQKKDMSVLVLSGPDVHLKYLHSFYLLRSNKQLNQLIIGKPSALALLPKEEHVNYMESTNWLEIDQVLVQATEIFSFFGYSTLMDRKFLSAQFHLIPCPNQWEQEYLSSIHPIIHTEK